MTVTIDTHAAIREPKAAGADAKLAEAIIATKSHVEAVVNKAIVQVILAQLPIAGGVVAFLKLTA